jgi:uncharacterized protein (TIGR00251 family)
VAWRVSPTGVTLDVRVVPRARREALLGLHDGALRIALTAPPVDGAANAALLVFVARSLGVPTRQVRLERGATGKTKVVAVDGAAPDDVRRWLDSVG